MSSSIHDPIRHASALSTGERVELGADHVRKLRAREINVKEAFTIVDRDGVFFRAALEAMEGRRAVALVYERMAAATESPAHITLLCAVLGRQRMLGVIQKSTELGVSRIVPVLSERSVQREGLAHEKAHAWPKQALRAVRQCRRASLPEVCEAVELRAALEADYFTKADLCVYLDDRAAESDPLAGATADGERRRSIVLSVGPEGGWTESERAMHEDSGALPLRLGGRVLRAETAVLVGLTLLQHAYGDM